MKSIRQVLELMEYPIGEDTLLDKVMLTFLATVALSAVLFVLFLFVMLTIATHGWLLVLPAAMLGIWGVLELSMRGESK